MQISGSKRINSVIISATTVLKHYYRLRGNAPKFSQISGLFWQAHKFPKNGKRKKTMNRKNFGRTPPGLCPVCPVDMSHLSRHLSRMSRGHSAPIHVNFHMNRPERHGCPWDVPNVFPGRSQGIPTTKFLYVTFLYRLLFSILRQPLSPKIVGSPNWFQKTSELACKVSHEPGSKLPKAKGPSRTGLPLTQKLMRSETILSPD